MRARGRPFRKYVLVFVAVIGGLLVVRGLVELYTSYRDNTAALVRLQREKAAAAALRIEYFIREIEGQVSWASRPSLMAQEQVAEQRRFDFLWLLRQVQAVTEVSYLDATGKEQLRVSRLAFVDLRDFTAFAETAEPEEVMGILREYHAGMGRLILAHEGTLERFAGDGMMVFFNDPVPVPNPCERAVRMALAMRDRLEGLILRWRKLGYDLAWGMGLVQGYATIGAIGFEGRWDYGAIGTVTNLAARLCGEAKPGQILVARRFLGTVEDLVEAEPAGGLSLKGFHRPIPAYNILRLKG